MQNHPTEPRSVRGVRNEADLCLVPYLASTSWRTGLTVHQAKEKKSDSTHHPGKFLVELKKKEKSCFSQ